MKDKTDLQLLRDYAENRSEEAFTFLVSRHVDFVYSAALRMLCDAHLAEDVTQSVFIALAQNAHRLAHHPVLSGWLHRTAQNIAAQAVRTNVRRHVREQEAAAMNELLAHEPDVSWKNIASHLDIALGELSEPDRDALLLRYFERKSAREMALTLKVSEEAAQKRVNRAVERLREFFSKRNVTVGASGLAVLISTNAVQAAPAALAKSLTAVAIVKGAATSGSTLTPIKGALKLMAWSKAKTIFVAGIAALLAVGTTVTVKEIVAHRPQVWQKRFDLAVLDTAPRQTTIFPALRSRSKDINGREEYHGMVLGLNVDATDIMSTAYQISRGRVIFSVPVPEGKYDYISNLPKNQREALQQEIKKKLGLVGRRELIETNVLVLTVRNPNAAGLKRFASADLQVSRTNGFISLSNYPISTLNIFLENNIHETDQLGTPVVDRTGLTGYYDLKWDSTPEGLKKAVLDNLGLELVPASDRVEFLVVNKTN